MGTAGAADLYLRYPGQCQRALGISYKKAAPILVSAPYLAASLRYAAHDGDTQPMMVQVQAQIQRKARVFVKADGLSAEQLRGAWFEPVGDLGQRVRERLAAAGAGARLAVLPQGPQTIPYIAN